MDRSTTLGDTVEAVIMAIDSKLASMEPLTIEDLQIVEKLVQAKARLEGADDTGK
jgi:hypothetical protein